MTAVNVGLLGRLVIDVGGKQVADARFGDLGRKAFAYLVLERRHPVPRDELADVLWGEDLPATWTAALRGTVSRSRSNLAEAGLVGPAGSSTPDRWRRASRGRPGSPSPARFHPGMEGRIVVSVA